MGGVEVEKVVCYVVRGSRLIAMRHVGRSAEEVGLQVPAGTVEPGESPAEAAIREVLEETAVADARVVRFLGVAEYDITPYRFELQRRHFFQVECSEQRERWRSRETSGPEPVELECFWLELVNAHVLQSGQGALVHRLFNATTG